MGILSTAISFFTNPVADIVGGWQARKTIASKTASDIAHLEGELKKTRLQASIDRLKNQDGEDADYDQKVLDNRRYTLMDDFLILFWLVIFAMHFIPATADEMAKGWIAIAKAPWWFQFGMVGILISTLGLMRLFRMWTDKKFSFARKQEGATS